MLSNLRDQPATSLAVDLPQHICGSQSLAGSSPWKCGLDEKVALGFQMQRWGPVVNYASWSCEVLSHGCHRNQSALSQCLPNTCLWVCLLSSCEYFLSWGCSPIGTSGSLLSLVPQEAIHCLGPAAAVGPVTPYLLATEGTMFAL